MDNKTKELIAVAASVSTNCIPCFDFHKAKALDDGASQKEVIIAARIGLQVSCGANTKMEQHLNNKITEFEKEVVENICQC
jgi:AhpD family alkylhydroperoxidase